MPTLEATRLTPADEQQFRALLMMAQLTATSEGIRPLGGYTPPAAHELAPLENMPGITRESRQPFGTQPPVPPRHPFMYHQPGVADVAPVPVAPGIDPEGYTVPGVPQQPQVVSAAGHAAVAPSSTPPMPAQPAAEKGEIDLYFGNRQPRRFDDTPPDPPLLLKLNRAPVNHRLSTRKPARHEARHRVSERRLAGRMLGYLAAVTSLTAGTLMLIPGIAH